MFVCTEILIELQHEVGHIIDTYSGLQKRKTPFSSEEEYSVAAKSGTVLRFNFVFCSNYLYILIWELTSG